jgi:hypothetical protein
MKCVLIECYYYVGIVVHLCYHNNNLKWWFWSFGYFGYGTQKWFDMQYVVWLLRCDHMYLEHWGWWPKDMNYQNATWIYITLLHDKHIHISQWRNWNRTLKSKNIQGHSFVFWTNVD